MGLNVQFFICLLNTANRFWKFWDVYQGEFIVTRFCKVELTGVWCFQWIKIKAKMQDTVC